MSANKKVINFSPGPAKLPPEVKLNYLDINLKFKKNLKIFIALYFQVIKKAQDELIHYGNTGISVMGKNFINFDSQF
jgi:phosphoserine aminotransferase